MKKLQSMFYYLVASVALSILVMAPANAINCRLASPGAEQWKNESFPAQDGKFSVSFRTIPRGSDVLIGLSKDAQQSWSGLAAIVRFYNNTIDVRNGDVYMSDVPMTYEPYASINVRMEVDMRRHRYSVFVMKGSQPETQIANDYAFRTEQQGVTVLSNSVVEAEVGTLEACMLSFKINECSTAMAGGAQWQNRSVIPMTYGQSEYSIEFDATPLGPPGQSVDALVALANGPQQTWSGLAAIVRFGPGGIDARNGDHYAHDWFASYSPNSPIHFLLNVRPSYHQYDVTAYYPGSTQPIPIARNYNFRTEQQQVSVLNEWVTEAEVGGVQACNFLVRYAY